MLEYKMKRTFATYRVGKLPTGDRRVTKFASMRVIISAPELTRNRNQAGDVELCV